MIIDTHTHYDDEAYDADREELLSGLSSRGVGIVVDIGVDIETSRAAIDLAGAHDYIYAVIGYHPSEVKKLKKSDIKWLREHAEIDKVVAIGEIGLDYHWAEDEVEKTCQAEWFREQISLAKEVSLPIVVHSREAAADTMNIIREEHAYECGGVIHCYSYSSEQAREYVDMGFYLGIGGVITYKNSKKLKETVAQTDLSHIVLETDCPYLTPEPHRGERNTSAYLKYVVREIAALKGVTEDEVISVTENNAHKLYGI